MGGFVINLQDAVTILGSSSLVQPIINKHFKEDYRPWVKDKEIDYITKTFLRIFKEG